VWLGMINNPNGTVGWGLSRNEWVVMYSRQSKFSASLHTFISRIAFFSCSIRARNAGHTAFCKNTGHGANAANKNMVTPPKLGGNPIP